MNRVANAALLRRSDDAFGGFRIESPGVGIGLAVEEREDEEDDATDERDEPDEVPPATSADVVKAANGDSQSWDEENEAVEKHQEQRDHRRLVLVRKCHGKECQEDHNDSIEKLEVPILFAAGAAAEVGGALPGEDESRHLVRLLSCRQCTRR